MSKGKIIILLILLIVIAGGGTYLWERNSNGGNGNKSPQKKFTKIEHHYLKQPSFQIPQDIKIWKNIKPKECAEKCLQEKNTGVHCKSFNYDQNTNQCTISKGTLASFKNLSPKKKKKTTYNQFNEQKIDENDPLTSFTKLTGLALKRHNDKVIDKIPAKECAKRCLQEKNFICQSFSYNDKTNHCQLSKSSINTPNTEFIKRYGHGGGYSYYHLRPHSQ